MRFTGLPGFYRPSLVLPTQKISTSAWPLWGAGTAWELWHLAGVLMIFVQRGVVRVQILGPRTAKGRVLPCSILNLAHPEQGQ